MYRLVGDVGELAVPDSLHALLAARLDALDPGVRRLVADAAVLGTTFPAEALIAVSGQDEAAVRAALDELVRREVLSVSADPLSPERGSYQFAQQMLRQVAYDTLSRRDRKTRHLAVAAHLRAAFPGDGEEVADVIARHYLDALDAVPDDPDTGRDPRPGHRRADPGRRTRRAHRRPRPAAASYATAADELTAGRHTRRTGSWTSRGAGMLWERAAEAAVASADWADGDRARGPCPRSLPRSAARPARPPAPRPPPGRRCACGAATAKRAISSPPPWRCCGQIPTPTRCAPWSSSRRWRCSPARPTPTGSSTEALTLGQALDVGTGQLAGLFTTRGIYLGMRRAAPRSGRLLPAKPRGSPRRPATTCAWDARCSTWRTHWRSPTPRPRRRPRAPPPGTCAGPATGTPWPMRSRTWSRRCCMLGDWDAAEEELTRAVDSDGLADIEILTCYRGWLAALRGDAATAEDRAGGTARPAGQRRPPGQGADQHRGSLHRRRPRPAGGRAAPRPRTRSLTPAPSGSASEFLRWAWPLAARAAHDLRDTAATGELLALLDACQPGHLAPMLRAERDLVRARLAARDA